MLLALVSLHSPSLVIPPPANLVVYGPGSLEVMLLTAKIAAQQGYSATKFIRPDFIERGNALMYGAKGPLPDARPTLASTNSQFGFALNAADAIVLCAESGGTTDITNTLRFAPKASRLVLLSAIGGSRGIGGQLGEGERVRMCEEQVAEAARAANVELSVVRVGPMKGGGASATPIDSLGLAAQAFYDTLRIGGYPTPSWQCAQDYDRHTLGCSVTAGDGVEPRSQGARSAGRSSHSPQRDEVSRINAALALLACLRAPTPLELSLSAEAGEAPPTAEAWDGMLAGVAA